MFRWRQNFDKRMENEIREHLNRYVKKYDDLSTMEKSSLDLLEYRVNPRDEGSNRIIDRDLLADYLNLKVAKSNNRLQIIVGIFVAVSAFLTAIQVAKLLNLIH